MDITGADKDLAQENAQAPRKKARAHLSEAFDGSLGAGHSTASSATTAPSSSRAIGAA
jgi:hypothetical protein